MSEPLSRRSFAALAAGAFVGVTANVRAQDAPKSDAPKSEAPASSAGKIDAPKPARAPTEAPFERDYEAPNFSPSWKNPQINKQLLQDFVIFAHTDVDMVKKLLVKEPGLAVASINWGAADWESGLGAAAHMGNREMADVLLQAGARMDLFCAAMFGQLDVIQAFLKLQPKLIDAKGPHGFSLHFHAQVGGKEAEPVLDYLQSVKKIELRPNPFLMKSGKKTESDKAGKKPEGDKAR